MRKKHGIDQNQAQKAFMISNLHKSAYLKEMIIILIS